MSDAVFGIMVNMKQNGFTVIELLLVIVLLGVGSWLFFNEKATIDATARDNQRKVAINAMYYGLEEYFYAKNGYYPASIDSKTNQQAAITKINVLATHCAVQWSVKILTPRLIAITRNNQLVIIRDWAAILERLNGIIKNRYLVFWISNIAKAIGCFVALGT